MSQNGLSVQATPIAVDTKGFVLIRVRAWLGETTREEALFQEVVHESVRFPAINPCRRRMAESKLQTLRSKRSSSAQQQAPQ